MAYELNLDELMFFNEKPVALELYETLADKLFAQLPNIGIRVQKTQITFTNPKVFACISFAKVRKAKERPKEYIVVTLGLDKQVQSARIDIATEPYPGRWTHHILIEHPEEIDDELMDWFRKAYHFARVK
ncbi:hypothetical protein GCM10008922_25840 [Faecalicatena contorta]|jgi:hypothetical protein|uniref:DUF5655 domain-containing protein n=1 Tax=Faecalicatena contorta TaxID=39482 RepID=UPI0031D0070F